MEGLGDATEKMIKYLRLDKLASDDCRCKERKDKLNKLVPFNKK